MMVLPLGDGKVKVHNNGLFSNETVSEICGFATVPNPEYFSSNFQQVRNLIPGKYFLLVTPFIPFISDK